MGTLEDTRKNLQDFVAPELRGIQARLDGIDQRFASLEHRMGDGKAELLRTIDFMLRELSLRMELAAGKASSEAAPVKAAPIEHQQYLPNFRKQREIHGKH